MFDLVIKNGKIIDGSGNVWFYGNLGIIGENITYIGTDNEIEGKEILDAQGMYVTPGFIDIHTHSDFTILQCPLAESKIRQGITTELAGHCGYSVAPINPKYFEGLKKFTAFMPGSLDWSWDSIGGFLDKIEEQGLSNNFQTLVGQGTLRIAVMGFEQRKASAQEMEDMKQLLRECLDQGAAGMSMGLVYSPGSFAPKEEIVELAKVLKEKNKMLTAHIRDEGDTVEEALREVLDIAELSCVKVQICHLKAQGKLNWSKMDILFQMIEETREKGIDVTFDVYAYTKLNTLLTALLPGWAQDGGVDAMVSRCSCEETRRPILEELEPIALKYGGWENITVASVNLPENTWTEGKTLLELATETKVTPGEAMLNLLRDDLCSIMVVCNCMEEGNVIKALKHPLSMLGSDGKILATEGPLSAGKPHPRNYGAFPRLLSNYIRNKGIMSLEEGIRKMTSASAQKMGLKDRGLLREGMKADIVIFDFNTIKDVGTFTSPHHYAEGIEVVIVNGALTVYKGKHTGALKGKVLR